MVEYIAQATPIYIFGDSHVLPFKGLALADPPHITKVRFSHGVVAHNFTTPNKELHPLLVQCLSQEGLLIRNQHQFQPFHHSASPEAEKRVQFSGRSRQVPLMLWLQGDVDVRAILLKQLGPYADFSLPAPLQPPPLEALPHPEPWATEQVISQIQVLLRPYCHGLIRLRQQGFTTLFVQGLPPPDPDEHAFEQENGYFCSTLTRYKAVLLFNRLLHQFCEQQGIPYIDIWPWVTCHGVRDPYYHLDSRHLNRHAAILTLQEIIKRLPESNILTPLYQSEYQQRRTAALTKRFDYSVYQRFLQQGLISLDIGESLTGLIETDFSVPAPAPPAAWSHCDIGNQGETWATTTIQSDRIAYLPQILTHWQNSIESCLLCPASLLNVRPICFLKDQMLNTSCLALDKYPLGLLKGWLWLTPLDDIKPGTLWLVAPEKCKDREVFIPINTRLLDLTWMATAQSNQWLPRSIPLGIGPIDPIYWRLWGHVS